MQISNVFSECDNLLETVAMIPEGFHGVKPLRGVDSLITSQLSISRPKAFRCYLIYCPTPCIYMASLGNLLLVRKM